MSTSLLRKSSRERARRALLAMGLVAGVGWLTGAEGSKTARAEERSDAFKIIVHPSNSATSASRVFVANAFLKKTTRWDDGELIRPTDLRPDSPVRARFSEVVLKRPVSAVRNYWQQRIFSGRETPPPIFDSDEAVVAYVSKHAGAIGYVSESANISGTKVLAVH